MRRSGRGATRGPRAGGVQVRGGGLGGAYLLLCAPVDWRTMVRVDSHLALPTVAATADVLRDRELVPFRAAIAAGVRAVMPGHLRCRAGRRASCHGQPADRDDLLGRAGFRRVRGDGRARHGRRRRTGRYPHLGWPRSWRAPTCAARARQRRGAGRGVRGRGARGRGCGRAARGAARRCRRPRGRPA